jgi:hypothetical protein
MDAAFCVDILFTLIISKTKKQLDYYGLTELTDVHIYSFYIFSH